MARLNRLVAPGHPHYVCVRAIAGVSAFPTDAAFARYLELLKANSAIHGVRVHAYALLSDSVHLVATPSTDRALSLCMQGVGRIYVAEFNRAAGRRGALWEGRFAAAPVQADPLFIDLIRYVEWRPVSSGAATHPADYEWSSARHHLGLQPSSLVSEHAVFWRLGNTPFDREAAYARLCDAAPDAPFAATVERLAARGWALGSSEFTSRLEDALGRRTQIKRPGRPPKSDMSPK
jgi:putative transposase